jgi:hypothetical protein
VVSHQQQTRSDQWRGSERRRHVKVESGHGLQIIEASPRLTELVRHDISATMCKIVLPLLLASNDQGINHDLRAILQEPCIATML